MQQEKIWDNIIKNLTEEQVIAVLSALGSQSPRRDNENNLVFQSVCHASNSWKLCYYVQTHSFFCYRDWESFNLFSLVMRVKNCDFLTALQFVCDLLGIKNNTKEIIQQGFVNNYIKSDWELFDKFNKLQIPVEAQETQEIYNPNILNLYSDIYYNGWIKEHISIDSMKKYNIKYDIPNARIIIPHYDINNNLIGIRCRNLSPASDIKYCPVSIEGRLYNHPLASNLYGLNHNINTIKAIRKAMICEAEKSVLQCATYFPENNFSVACCGSNISYEQIRLLLSANVETVILAMDWDFEEQCEQNNQYILYKKKILKLCQKLTPYFTVKVLLPPDNNFIYKCSPTDLGRDYLLKTMKNKITVSYETICNERELEKERKEG